MDNISENVKQITLEQLKTMYGEVQQANIDQVRQAAQKFKNEYDNYLKLKNSIISKMSKSIQRRGEISRLEQQVRPAFYEFQNTLNAFYGQAVKVIYTYMDPDSGKITLGVLDNDNSHLQVSPVYGALQYHVNQINTILKDDIYDSTQLDETQQSIYQRWQVAKQITKRSRYIPILWKIGNSWGGAKVNNLGTIAEAYVNFYIHRYTFMSDLELNVATYILHPFYGAAAVDNASGLLIGDVSLPNSMINLAVKKDSASPMKMQRVYEAVSQCLNSSVFSTETLWQAFVDDEKTKAVQNQVIQNFNGMTKETVGKIIKELEKWNK